MQKVLLMVLDGFGEGKDYKGNAIKKAPMKYIEALKKKYPHTLLKTDGNAVGLPPGTMGGSEAGHLTMGAGRIVWQPLEEINRSIKSGDFFKKEALLKACIHVKEKYSCLHLIGMLSDGGVHSHEKHLYTLLKLAKRKRVKDVFIHVIADGRDVHPHSVNEYIEKLEKKINRIGVGKIASVVGRFYAMDRDKNWNRTKEAYTLYTEDDEKIEDFKSIIQEFYKEADHEEANDYYLPPLQTEDFQKIKKKDAVIFFNFRSDRARQLTEAFVNNKFKEFEAKIKPVFVCMGPYSNKAPVVFPPNKVKNNLGETISKKGISQLRIAETEKYAHVNFFFNSQNHNPYKAEYRILINSPKVHSYAEKPEMSAYKITDRILRELKKEKYGFILLNFANLDLVGHSGNLKAAIKACQIVDECTGKIIEKALSYKYEIIITGDHGNAEEMLYEDGEECTSHTLNPTCCIVLSDRIKKLRKGKGLSALAPTVLELMGIKKPKEMTGGSLVMWEGGKS